MAPPAPAVAFARAPLSRRPSLNELRSPTLPPALMFTPLAMYASSEGEIVAVATDAPSAAAPTFKPKASPWASPVALMLTLMCRQ